MHISCQFTEDSGLRKPMGMKVIIQDSKGTKTAFFWKLTCLRRVILANSYISLYD